MFQLLEVPSLPLLTATVILSGIISVPVYRLFFHPLSGFPGPKLAAISEIYRFYYDVVKSGEMSNQLFELHRVYGPVVRTGPNRLHFAQYDAFFDIYKSGSDLIKDHSLYGTFPGMGGTSFTIVDPQDAKERRELLLPMFSRRAILSLEKYLRAQISKFVDRLAAFPKDQPVDLVAAFKSVTLDVISDYCIAQSFNATDHPTFHHEMVEGIEASLVGFWWLNHIPFLITLTNSIPAWLMEHFNPSMGGFKIAADAAAKFVDAAEVDPTILDRVEHETIFHHILSRDVKKLRNPPSRESIIAETLMLLFAGSETVANASVLGFFYILNDRRIRETLTEELRNACRDNEGDLPLVELEKLPYLTACIKEALRFSYGVVTALNRVNPTPTIIGKYAVPAGTIIGSSIAVLQHDPTIFPDPFIYRPERWLENKDLTKYLVSFSKGPRACYGINLGWAELYLIFGTLFRKLDMEVWNTTVDDLYVKDFFNMRWRGRPLHVLINNAAKQ